MLQKIDLNQLQSRSLEEIEAYKKEIEKRKTELEALKVKGGKTWTSELQEELDDIALFLVDIDEIIEEKAVDAKTTSYAPAPGTENMIHLSLIKGRRFNPFTGKEESKVFTQIFTFSEWQLFEKNYKGLGYTIIDVLHNPYEKNQNSLQKTN